MTAIFGIFSLPLTCVCCLCGGDCIKLRRERQRLQMTASPLHDRDSCPSLSSLSNTNHLSLLSRLIRGRKNLQQREREKRKRRKEKSARIQQQKKRERRKIFPQHSPPTSERERENDLAIRVRLNTFLTPSSGRSRLRVSYFPIPLPHFHMLQSFPHFPGSRSLCEVLNT
jgi:hypothetical protein